jgi:hypothetical protein
VSSAASLLTCAVGKQGTVKTGMYVNITGTCLQSILPAYARGTEYNYVFINNPTTSSIYATRSTSVTYSTPVSARRSWNSCLRVIKRQLTKLLGVYEQGVHWFIVSNMNRPFTITNPHSTIGTRTSLALTGTFTRPGEYYTLSARLAYLEGPVSI